MQHHGPQASRLSPRLSANSSSNSSRGVTRQDNLVGILMDSSLRMATTAVSLVHRTAIREGILTVVHQAQEAQEVREVQEAREEDTTSMEDTMHREITIAHNSKGPMYHRNNVSSNNSSSSNILQPNQLNPNPHETPLLLLHLNLLPRLTSLQRRPFA